MIRRWLLSVSLALLLVFGQQGAAMHAVSHLADAQHQQKSDKSHTNAACDQCLAYAKLSSALGSSLFSAPLIVLSAFEYDRSGRSAESSPLRAYGARAPPYLS